MRPFCFRKWVWLPCIVLVMPGLSLFAQQSNYSLADLIDSAQHHLPVLMQKKALADAARAGITDARHTYLPTAYLGDEVTVGTDNSLPGSYLSYGVIPSSSSGVRSANTYQAALGNIAFLSSQYELLDFGLKKATVQRAEANSNLSQADLNREIYLVKWQVGKLYLETLKNQYQLGIEQENISRYDTVYLVIGAITRAGIKPGADSALAMAELSNARVAYNQTFGQIRQLQQQLSYLTGIPLSAISPDTTRARGDQAATEMLSLLPDSVNTQNPLVDYFGKQQLLYRQTEEWVKRSYLPKVFLNAIGWGRGSSFDYTDNYASAIQGLGYQRFNYMAGLTLEYDLFNPVHRKDKLSIARNNTKAGDYEFQQQVLSIQNVGNKADEGLKTAAKNLQEIPIQIRSAEAAFAQKTAQYKAGIINLVDLTNASFVLYRSESNYVQTVSDWLLANLDKSAANGNLDLFIQSIK